MHITTQQCADFLASGGLQAVGPPSKGLSSMADTLNAVSAKVGLWELFTKAQKVLTIWVNPDWSANGIIAKIAATYDLFKLPATTPPAPPGPLKQ